MLTRRSDAYAGAAFLLIVDDELSVLEVARSMACSIGWQPLLANTAKHAIELFELHSHSIDHVLVDLHMPGMGGLELARALRALRPDVQIDVMTGDAEGAESLLADEPAVDGILVKPFVIADLEHALDPHARAA